MTRIARTHLSRGPATSQRLLSILGLILAAALFAPTARAGAAMYWGGTIKGDVYGIGGDAPTSQAVLDKFEEDAGKKITFVNTGQSWASFDQGTMSAAIAAGAIPLVTMGLEGATLAEVAAGKQDAQIRAWAEAAKVFGYPFLFRPWWEMNGNWYPWGRSPDYVAAWRHFHDVVEEVGATNVTWAWVVNTIWSNPESDPTPYYPGDAYVDWVGIDAYNWGTNELQPDRWLTPAEAVGPTLELLRRIAPEKPVCICEDASTEVGGDKAAWIREMLRDYLPSQPDVKAYLWFNWDVEQNGKSGRWDWPIESSAAAEQAFREGIQSSTYLSSLPPLPRLGKVPIPTLPAPLPPAAAAPSLPTESFTPRRFALGKRQFDTGTGTVELAVTFPGPGTVALKANEALISVPALGIRRVPHGVKTVSGAASVTLKLAAIGAARRRLATSGRARVAVAMTFTPTGGSSTTRRALLTLRRPRQ